MRVRSTGKRLLRPGSSVQPASSSELHDLAVDEINAGNLPAALTHALQAVDIDSGNIAYRETLARVHYRMGDLPAVIAIYNAFQ